jgi:hypothetical protein
MLRAVGILLAGAGCVCWSTGCSHMVESRVVRAFAESLEKEDLAGLRKQSSDNFEARALPGSEAFSAIKMVELPEGKAKVVKVVDKEDEKRVTVEFGPAKHKVLYRLKRDEKTRNWVVDDIYLNRSELIANKPLSAKLNLFMSVREFLDAWESGERDRIIATVTPEFAHSLSALPPRNLAVLAQKTTAGMAHMNNLRPSERIGEETADVRLPKDQGELHIALRRVEERWRVDDVSVESRRSEDSMASVKEIAAATSAALTFQAAYRSADKRTLEQVCSTRFFTGSLASADLSQVPLPPGATDNVDVKLEGGTATFVVPGPQEVLKISLAREPTEELNPTIRYQVDDVTIYELNGMQDKRLSALFTAHVVMDRFAAALAGNDLKELKQGSTHDFNQRVWSSATEPVLRVSPLREIPAMKPRIIRTRFRGPLTMVDVDQGDLPITYVLRDEGGRMLVDDVLAPADARPESLKSVLEVMIPVVRFTAALDAGLKARNAELIVPAAGEDDPETAALKELRGVCTYEFSRFVWNQVDRMPDMSPAPLPYLRYRLSGVSLIGDRETGGVQVVGERAIVVLGDDSRGAKINLIKERGAYRIDDVTLIAGIAHDQRIPMKKTLRTVVAHGGQLGGSLFVPASR